MIIELKTHPAFLTRETATSNSTISVHETNLLKGFMANVDLVERALERFNDAPGPESLKLIVNSRLAISRLLTDIESVEPDFEYASDSFVSQYADFKARLVILRDELEVAAATYQPPAPQPVQITVTVAPQPKQKLGHLVFAVVVLVTTGGAIMSAVMS